MESEKNCGSLVKTYFGSKIAEYDVTLTSFAADLL